MGEHELRRDLSMAHDEMARQRETIARLEGERDAAEGESVRAAKAERSLREAEADVTRAYEAGEAANVDACDACACLLAEETGAVSRLCGGCLDGERERVRPLVEAVKRRLGGEGRYHDLRDAFDAYTADEQGEVTGE